MSHFHHLRSHSGASCSSDVPCPDHPPHIHSASSLLDIFEGDRSLPPVQDEGVLQRIVTRTSFDNDLELSSPEPAQNANKTRVRFARRTAFSQTHSPSRSPSPCPSPSPSLSPPPCPEYETIIKRRNSNWAKAIRHNLVNITSRSPCRRQKLRRVLAYFNVPAPQTEKEIDKFLLCVWGNKCAGPTFKMDRRTSLEVQELKDFFDRELQELKKDYKIRLSQLSQLAEDSSASSKSQFSKAMREEQKKVKCFDRLRFNLKEQIAAAILQLIPESLSICKRLSPRATRNLTCWYEKHSKHPYPTASQKETLARRCAITVDQVNNWFISKRTRTAQERRTARGRRQRRRRTAEGRRKRRKKRRRRQVTARGRGINEVIIRHVRRRLLLW